MATSRNRLRHDSHETEPLRPPLDGTCSVYLSATQYSRAFFAKHGFAFVTEDPDDAGNIFETMRFPFNGALCVASEKALAQSRVHYPKTLSVPIQHQSMGD